MTFLRGRHRRPGCGYMTAQWLLQVELIDLNRGLRHWGHNHCLVYTQAGYHSLDSLTEIGEQGMIGKVDK